MARFTSAVVLLISLCVTAFAAPVHDAAAKDDLQKLEALLRQNVALLNARDKQGATPLHYAAAKGADAVANYLIEHKADLTARKKDGVTPLHVAAGTGQKGIVEILLKAGADAKAVDKKGRTPLSLAQQRNYPEIAKLIEEHLKSPTPVKRAPARIEERPGPREPTPTAPPNFQAKARQLVELTVKRDFAGVEKMFDDTLRSKLPAPRMQTEWNALTAKSGPFVKLAGMRQTTEQGLNVVYATLQFEKGSGDIKLVFDSAGQLSGFWILPPNTAK